MTDITIHTAGAHQVTCVSNAFIDEYMHDASGEFVKIYLYLLRMLCHDDGRFSLSAMADKFHYTESDIRRGLSYWEKMHLLHLEYDTAGKLIGICLLEPQGCSQVTVSPASVSVQPSPKAQPKPAALPAKHPEMSRYSPEEIMHFQDREDVRELMMVAETYIGHPLSMSDVNTVLYWYDSLRFSTELIEYLVEFCVEKGHPSLYYMNKVALNWSENGISDVSEAKQTAQIHSQSYYAVMKAFGITGRSLIPAEISFIEKWTGNYGFTLDIINEACSRTIRNTGKANFEYADSILTSWHQKGILHLEDIASADKEHAAAKTAKPKAKTGANRFHNFDQRPYDDDFYDHLEQQLLQK